MNNHQMEIFSNKHKYTLLNLSLENLKLVFKFLHEMKPDNTNIINQALWNWKFVMNPLNKNVISFYTLEAGGKVKGTIGYIRFKVNIKGTEMDACHPMTYFVDDSLKGLPALQLLLD